MDMIICPECGTENPTNAINCKQCQTNLKFAFENPKEIEHIQQPAQGLSEPSPTSEPGEAMQDGIYCSACGHLNASWRSECEKCRTKLFKPGSPTYSRVHDRPGCVTGHLLIDAETGEVTYSRVHDRPGCVTAYAVLLGIGAGLIGLAGIWYGLSEEEFGGMVFAVVVAVLEFLLARGVWRLKNWARIIVIVLQSLGILAGIVGLFSGNVLNLVGLAIGGYILYWFASHGEYFE